MSLLAGCPAHRPAPDSNPTPAGTDNGLAGSSSAYLQSHAHDAVDWQPWTPAVLERARAAGKPLFVSSGYAACHWCHVMHDDVFSRGDVATLLNSSFTCIKVDREEQPELDGELFAVQRSLGGETGWPLNVWMTPDASPFFAAAGMNHADFLATCQRIADNWKTRPELFTQAGEQLRSSLSGELVPQPGTVGPDILRTALAQELAQADTQFGGRTGEQKFPLPARWRFVAASLRFQQDAALAAQLRLTLDMLDSGAVHDQIGGGFHRYTEDMRWQRPHFEKMLADNAQLASLHLEAATALDEPRYRAVALDTLDFMLRDMQAPEGGFHASLSAVDALGEGGSYRWTSAQVGAVLDAADAPIVARVLALPAIASPEDPTAVALPDRRTDLAVLGRELGMTPQSLEALWRQARPRLLSERQTRSQPAPDHKLVTAWNGMAISALAQGYLATSDERYLEAANRAADAILQQNRPNGSLLRATTQGRGEAAASAADYALLATGLMNLYEAGSDPARLRTALELLDQAGHAGNTGLPQLAGSAGGGTIDAVEPSPGAALLHARLLAAQLTGDGQHLIQADELLAAHGGSIAKAGIEAGWWLHGALLLQHGLYSVVVASDHSAGRDMLRSAFAKLAAPNAALACIPAAGATADQLALQPMLQGKLATQDRPTAYVCSMSSCLTPVQDAADLSMSLQAACDLLR